MNRQKKRSIVKMLRQIIINSGHCRHGSVPQCLAMNYLDVVTVQLFVVAEWIETGSIARKHAIIIRMTQSKDTFVQQASNGNIAANLRRRKVEL